ncbi:hypothetical protein B0T20DRAFT_196663 [Sordaria brevicollis]|uniref:Uncharacterized protein n=1 Tax=Sordaria brevicollis TaxID=83679 RepID=A0AAE0PGX0_SORBR|nr:hypothetical protein B0T20DRAFT_196663 [Sordaria brevicollis]
MNGSLFLLCLHFSFACMMYSDIILFNILYQAFELLVSLQPLLVYQYKLTSTAFSLLLFAEDSLGHTSAKITLLSLGMD